MRVARVGAQIRTGGIPVIYGGALASATATFVGHFPWFYTYNILDTSLPPPAQFMPSVGNEFAQKLVLPTRIVPLLRVWRARSACAEASRRSCGAR